MAQQKSLTALITDELILNSEKYQEEIWHLVRSGLERLSDLELNQLAERMSVNIDNDDDDE